MVNKSLHHDRRPRPPPPAQRPPEDPHGHEDAPIHAAMRADEMLEKGDLDGYAVWKRIVKAVEELVRVEPPPDMKLH